MKIFNIWFSFIVCWPLISCIMEYLHYTFFLELFIQNRILFRFKWNRFMKFSSFVCLFCCLANQIFQIFFLEILLLWLKNQSNSICLKKTILQDLSNGESKFLKSRKTDYPLIIKSFELQSFRVVHKYWL